VQAVISMSTTERVSRLVALRQRLERLRLPGTRKKKKSGRPSVWKDHEGFLLILAVNSIRAERKKGVADAIRILQRRTNRWARYSVRTLEARFQEARKHWTPIVKYHDELIAISLENTAIGAEIGADKVNIDPLYRLLRGQFVTKSRKYFP
jgi:hypothetical protein